MHILLFFKTSQINTADLAKISLFGYDQGVMGGLLTLPSFVKTFPEINTIADPTNNYVTTIQGISVASYNLGM